MSPDKEITSKIPDDRPGARGEAPVALITGITGQDGSYLAELLLEKGDYLGNLDAKRDWGYARDYVKGMWRMLQVETPGDYVLATGRTTTVREFARLAFKAAEIDIVLRARVPRRKDTTRRRASA